MFSRALTYVSFSVVLLLSTVVLGSRIQPMDMIITVAYHYGAAHLSSSCNGRRLHGADPLFGRTQYRSSLYGHPRVSLHRKTYDRVSCLGVP